MKKLEDIPRKNLFEAPSGYFETLPTIIQAKVIQQAKGRPFKIPAFAYVKLALPVMILTVGLIWYFNINNKPISTDELLASIDSEELIEYLNETDISHEDFVESLDYTNVNADSLYFNELNLPIDENDITNVLSEFETEL